MKSKLILCLAVILPIVWFASVLPTYGLSMEIPITPDSLGQGQCAFSISNNAVEDGVSFHVIITAKSSEIISNSTAGLSIVKHWANTNGSSSEITGVKPAAKITLEKNNQIETADFTVTRELLKNPDLYFVFTVQHYDTLNGRRIPASSADFYEIKLQDFLK